VRAPRERRADHERRSDCGRRCAARDAEDLHVVPHVEHRPSGEEDDPDGQQHGDERERDQLHPRGGEQRQAEGHHEPDAERQRGDDEREAGHGTNR
jgi:hypothetical protein